MILKIASGLTCGFLIAIVSALGFKFISPNALNVHIVYGITGAIGFFVGYKFSKNVWDLFFLN